MTKIEHFSTLGFSQNFSLRRNEASLGHLSRTTVHSDLVPIFLNTCIFHTRSYNCGPGRHGIHRNRPPSDRHLSGSQLKDLILINGEIQTHITSLHSERHRDVEQIRGSLEFGFPARLSCYLAVWVGCNYVQQGLFIIADLIISFPLAGQSGDDGRSLLSHSSTHSLIELSCGTLHIAISCFV
jgi:hypothetical protein